MITQHYRKLMAIARKNGVQVHFLPQRLFDLDWDGLYINTPTLGPGVAVREGLPLDVRDWVLGHELGHHDGNVTRSLFSPFMAHTVTEATRREWGTWRRLDPAEEYANRWAAETLISQEDWERAEQDSPCDLRRS